MHRFIVLLTAAAGAIFVFALAADLPETVATRFGLSGAANGHSSRTLFLLGMSATAGLVPTLVWWLQERAIRMGKAKIPNAALWLGPKHRLSTERWLRTHTAFFCVMTTLFVAFVYWLVVRANQVEPAVLPGAHFWPAVLAYGLAVSVWAAMPYLRFRSGSDA